VQQDHGRVAALVAFDADLIRMVDETPREVLDELFRSLGQLVLLSGTLMCCWRAKSEPVKDAGSPRIDLRYAGDRGRRMAKLCSRQKCVQRFRKGH
jgi:hypothetical protein